MSGHENEEPNDQDYIDVVNIGEDDEDSEVTIFYRPHKGLTLSLSPFWSDNNF